MAIVPAHVGELSLGGVGEACFLFHEEGVHISSESDAVGSSLLSGRPFWIFNIHHESCGGDWPDTLLFYSDGFEVSQYLVTSFYLLEASFWELVQVSSELDKSIPIYP